MNRQLRFAVAAAALALTVGLTGCESGGGDSGGGDSGHTDKGGPGPAPAPGAAGGGTGGAMKNLSPDQMPKDNPNPLATDPYQMEQAKDKAQQVLGNK